eukprot:m.110719 g.110719  ORF g.110719 m.110719 type:complete len:462 (+) comp28062_c1_seq4:141-1526(+)
MSVDGSVADVGDGGVEEDTTTNTDANAGQQPRRRFFGRRSQRPKPSLMSGKDVNTERPAAKDDKLTAKLKMPALQLLKRRQKTVEKHTESEGGTDDVATNDDDNDNHDDNDDDTEDAYHDGEDVDFAIESVDEDHVELPALLPEDQGQVLHDSLVQCSLKDLHRILFCGSKWNELICNYRNLEDLNVTGWERDEGNQTRTREIKCSKPLNIRFGPKHTDVIETQTETEESRRDDRCRVISSVIELPGVPYGSSFEGKMQYVLAYDTSSSTRLRISAEIIYKKKLWAIAKSMVTKTAKDQMAKFCLDGSKALLELLHQDTQVQLSHLHLSPARRLSRRLSLGRQSMSKGGSGISLIKSSSRLSSSFGLFGSPSPHVTTTNDDVEDLETVVRRSDLTAWIQIPVSVSAFLSNEMLAVGLAVVVVIDQRLLMVIVVYLIYRVWQLEQKVLRLADHQITDSNGLH